MLPGLYLNPLPQELRMFTKRLVLIACLILAPSLLWASSDATHYLSPKQALEILEIGNTRFAQGQPIHPNTSFSRRLVTTTEGQTPLATIIACSDSRVPVEILFDQGIGDLFVTKVAGNVADTDEIGSAEYGVDHLGTPVLMVLGHTHCGAVTAVVSGAEVHGCIPQLVDNIVPVAEAMKHHHPDMDQATLIAQTTLANIWTAIETILAKSPAIAARAAQGKVTVVGGMYDILTGKVEILGEHPNQAALLAAYPKAVAPHATAPAQQTHQAVKKHAEPAAASETHAEKAAPAATHVASEADTHQAPAAHGEEQSTGGGFGFFSFIIFVLLLIGTVMFMDKTVHKPEE